MRTVIITRLGIWPSSEDWKRERLPLFTQVCLPSVASQDRQDFQWVLLSCQENEEWARPLVEQARQVLGRLDWLDVQHLVVPTTQKDIYCHGRLGEPEIPPEVDEQLQLLLAPAADESILTIRLDSDDAIAPWFVSGMQRYAERYVGKGLRFALGAMIRQDDMRIALRAYGVNHFMGYVSEPGSRQHVMTWPHDRFDPATVALWSEVPNWFQFVGRNNISSHRWVDHVFAPGSESIERSELWPYQWIPDLSSSRS